MLPAFLIGGGIVYLYLTRMEDYQPTVDEATPADEPAQPPKPVMPTGDDYRVEEVAKGDQNNIYLLESRRGVLYDDGSGGYSWEKSGYIRGDFPVGFVMAPTSVGGSMTFTINDMTYENVLVYKSQEDAIAADKKEEPKPDDPQKQPDADDDADDSGSLPLKPPTGLPGMGGSWSGPLFGGVQ